MSFVHMLFLKSLFCVLGRQILDPYTSLVSILICTYTFKFSALLKDKPTPTLASTLDQFFQDFAEMCHELRCINGKQKSRFYMLD